MCFSSSLVNGEIPDPLVAEEDIEVYKLLSKSYSASSDWTGEYRAYYQNFKYEKGTCYKGNELYPLKGTCCNDFNIKEGFHSYTKDIAIFNYEDEESVFLVKFIIPKGTKYYQNNMDEYVSQDITFPTQ